MVGKKNPYNFFFASSGIPEVELYLSPYMDIGYILVGVFVFQTLI